ncbi:M20/M25/M40 family metallo-hydrolase [Ferrimonas lipolytica]|uniref:Carboxypeptidase Q n=1 Tax=Ferrimonas lipolytica TaxID=2724191 RepID=A0A6H1U8Z3_9GAMM|nr:M20/M25/M40 family metallo-hydrolase [Ferrimonas lipolytica]QIZ75494.1 M20/M25/M40 family metallo-hydrolase [Ferrimonas lipolytica]
MQRAILAFSLFSASALASPFSPQTIEIAEQLQLQAMASDAAYQIVADLTTEIGPRLPGTVNDARAVAWAKARFEQMGFDKVYLEPVEVPHWERGGIAAKVTSPFPQPLLITALGNSVSTPPDGITAEIVRFANLAELEAAAAKSLDGKLAFIDHKMERSRDGRGYGPVVTARSKGASIAASKGAVGLMLRSVGTDSHRFAHTGVMRYAAGIAQVPAVTLSAPDADQLTRMLQRDPHVEVTLNVKNQAFPPKTSYNVIGEISGSSKADEIVLIGAHLDSWDEGTGALDDGAGVGIVVAAAKQIIDANLTPERTIRVVLFAAEEIGLVGAKAYRDAHQAELSNHYIAAEADFGAGPIYKIHSRVGEHALADFDAMAKQLESLGVKRGNNNSWGGPDMSVLPPLGVPVAGLALDGTDYFDYHHTPDDTLDKVPPAAIQQSSAVYTVFTWLMANSESNFRPIPIPTK